MLNYYCSPQKPLNQTSEKILAKDSRSRNSHRRKRRIPGSYANWKQYGGDVKEAIAVVGRQPVCVRRYLIGKGIHIPASTINYYVNKYIAEDSAKLSFF
ncbi:MAG: 22K protein [psittacine adenovirus 7]|uniref:22K protein n=1 Tax=psittacine adenovirus 7 TaxID=2848040 RepID=A0A6B9LJA5_9ADEN|nr:MAG: 22K protein [psittacine adenovirus 7]QHB43570.1 MAG: 22K protein [psittacine adenovirus 7]